MIIIMMPSNTITISITIHISTTISITISILVITLVLDFKSLDTIKH